MVGFFGRHSREPACAGKGGLAAVLDTLEWLHHETTVWLELTTLLIPGLNDSDDELDRLTTWVVDHLGPDVPLHFTAFHPDFRLLDRPRTPPETLSRARRIALEERTRIARELHDVVAHHMSLMAIRAESAPHRLAALPDPVRAEFGALSGSAREALADMRRLLGVLRSDQPTGRAPQPGLPDLPGLIDSARQAGMAVELIAPPALDRVPPGTGVCAYRIVQEALSNAGRHAAGTPVTVSVRHDAGTVTLQVTNGPGVPAGPRANGPRANGHGPGHGLAGMRERAELLGGSLSAGPTPDGGFAVSAVLPLSGSPA